MTHPQQGPIAQPHQPQYQPPYQPQYQEPHQAAYQAPYQGTPTQPGYPVGQPMQPPPAGWTGAYAATGAQPVSRTSALVWTLGLVSILGVVLGISLKEDGANAWHSVHAWGGLAIAGAVLTLAPVAGHSFGMTAARAWQTAVVGAGALVLYWVLFVLPSVGSNTSLLTTIGVAAGAVAAWLAPGKTPADGRPPAGNAW